MANPLPSWARTPAVLVTLILCATLVVLALIAGLAVLLFYGKGTDPITNLFSAANLVGLAALWAKVQAVERNTNGNFSKMTDAVIKSPPGGGS